jgi:hypothetical protein
LLQRLDFGRMRLPQLLGLLFHEKLSLKNSG